jgi:hypothetical protein
MDQPVNIRIEFPRSGQQLRLTVPHHIAQTIQHTAFEGMKVWFETYEGTTNGSHNGGISSR